MTSAEVEELNTGLLLHLPYRAMENKVFAALAAAGFEDLTLARGRIFQRIGPAGTRLTDLAEQAQVTKQAAGALVDELERAGYVTRTPDPTDNRARLVCIAERGIAASTSPPKSKPSGSHRWEFVRWSSCAAL